MLGFAMRAGKLVIGTDQVCHAMSRGGRSPLPLILVSETASDATKKKVTTKAAYYGIPASLLPIDTGELGRLLGKEYAPATVMVTAEPFIREIRAALSNIQRKEVSQPETGD